MTIEKNICDAIDIIVRKRISELKFDKTIQGTVSSCVNPNTGEYKVQYQDSSITCFCPDPGTIFYKNGTQVYVLVPSNDFANRKVIIGTTAGTVLNSLISTWSGTYNPDLENAPASNWPSEEEKIAHLNDIFRNTDTGISFIFKQDGTEGDYTYSWFKVPEAVLDVEYSHTGDNLTADPETQGWTVEFQTDTIYLRQRVGDNPWQGPVKIVAEDGIGYPGADGVTHYIHFKYSNDSVNHAFTGNNGTDPGDYLGILVDTESAASTNKDLYSWSLIKGNDAVAIDLLSESDVVFAEADGSNYSTIPSNMIRLYSGGVLIDSSNITFGVMSGNNIVNTLTVDGLTASVTIDGTVTFSGTWNNSSSFASFIFAAKYSINNTTYRSVYTIAKSKKGDDSVLIDLVSEADVAFADKDGGVATLPSGNAVKLYKGGSLLTSGISYTPSLASGGITQNGLKLSINTNGTINLSQNTVWTSNSETFVIVATVVINGISISRTTNYSIAKSKTGATGDSAITIDLLSESDVVSADADGSNYSAIPDNGINLYSGGTLLSPSLVTYGAMSGVNIVNALTVSGLTATISTSGVVTFSGTWAAASSSVSFPFAASYNNVVYNATYTIAKSKKGDDTVLIDLISEADVVAADKDGGVTSLPSGNAVKIYKGGNLLTSGITYSPSLASEGITQHGLKLSVSTNGTINLSQNTVWTSNNEIFTITASVVINGVSKNYITSYSIAKSKTGATGANAIVGFLTNENTTLAADSAGNILNGDLTPANGIFRVFDGTLEKTSSGSPTTIYSKVSQSGCNMNISSTGVYTLTELTSNLAIVILQVIYGGVTIQKTVTISKAIAGINGIAKTLSLIGPQIFNFNTTGQIVGNTTITLSIIQSGLSSPSPNLANAYHWYYGLDGAAPTTAMSVGITDPIWTDSNPVTLTIGYQSPLGLWATTAKSITIKTVSIEDSSVSDVITLYKVQDGAKGNDAVIYDISPSVQTVVKSSTGFTPTQVLFSFFRTSGETRASYTGYYKTQYTTDGLNYLDIPSGSGFNSSKVITLSNTYKAIRCRLYTDSGFNTQVDYKTVLVVSDGTSVTGPTGNWIKTIYKLFPAGTTSVTIPDNTSPSPSGWLDKQPVQENSTDEVWVTRALILGDGNALVSPPWDTPWKQIMKADYVKAEIDMDTPVIHHGMEITDGAPPAGGGFWMGLKNYLYQFVIGNASKYLKWDGNLTIYGGDIIGGSITGASFFQTNPDTEDPLEGVALEYGGLRLKGMGGLLTGAINGFNIGSMSVFNISNNLGNSFLRFFHSSTNGQLRDEVTLQGNDGIILSSNNLNSNGSGNIELDSPRVRIPKASFTGTGCFGTDLISSLSDSVSPLYGEKGVITDKLIVYRDGMNLLGVDTGMVTLSPTSYDGAYQTVKLAIDKSIVVTGSATFEGYPAAVSLGMKTLTASLLSRSASLSDILSLSKITLNNNNGAFTPNRDGTVKISGLLRLDSLSLSDSTGWVDIYLRNSSISSDTDGQFFTTRIWHGPIANTTINCPIYCSIPVTSGVTYNFRCTLNAGETYDVLNNSILHYEFF